MRFRWCLLFFALCAAAQEGADIDATIKEANRLLLADELAASTALLEPIASGSKGTAAQRAQALIALSTISLFRYELETMRELAEQALDLAAGSDNLALEHADALRLLDSYYGEKGDYEKALAIVEEEITLRKARVPGQAKLERALIGKAITQAQLGLLRRAELTILEAYDVAREQDPDGHVTQELIRVNHGYILSLRKQFRAARRLYAESVAYREQYQPNSSRMANALANLSEVELALGELESAAEHVSRGLEIVVSAAPGSRVHSDLLRLKAKVERGSGDEPAALDSLAAAVELYRAASPDSAEMLVPLIEYGRALLANGNLAGAERALQEAQSVGSRHVPQTGNFARVLHALAALHRTRNQPDQALTLLTRAVDALDVQYAVVGASAEDIADYASEFQVIHDDLATALLQRHQVGPALNAVDRFRERVLLERIRARSSLRSRYQGDPEITALELRRQALLQALAAATLPAEQQSLNAQLSQVRRALSLKAVEVAAPQGLSTAAADRDVVAAAREALIPSQLIVMFARIHDDYHRFILSQDALEHRVVGDARTLEQQAEALRALLDSEASRSAYEPLLVQLASDLLGHVQKPWAGVDRILVVADGALQILPFAALPVPQTGEPLIRTATLAFSNSIAAWLSQSVLESANAASEFAGFAYAGQNNTLKFVEDEVRGAAGVFSGKPSVAVGGQASETRAKASQSQVLHLAAHAQLDAGDAYQSFVQLAPSEQDDGLLEVFEIMRAADLKAELVVLSACETALGTAYAGEGILGLAKAFAYTGIPRVIASLWRVEDESTRFLMQAFYEQKAAGLDTAAALRAAQLRLLEGSTGSFWWRLTHREQVSRFQHPRYWAGFTLIGAF